MRVCFAFGLASFLGRPRQPGEQIWLGELYGASNMSMDQFWNNSAALSR